MMKGNPEADSNEEVKHTPAARETGCEIKITQGEELFDWQTLFGNAYPVEIEIGCGRGRFIITRARENPDINFLGIEKSARFFRILKDRVVKSGAHNIKVIRGEAGYLLKKFVPCNSVRAVHVYFPDPWPKKRHRKRRLVNVSFLENIAHVLTPEGVLHIATDFQDYAHEILAAAASCRGLAGIFYEESSAQDRNPDTAATAYERKYLLQGHIIYRALFKNR